MPRTIFRFLRGILSSPKDFGDISGGSNLDLRNKKLPKITINVKGMGNSYQKFHFMVRHPSSKGDQWSKNDQFNHICV